jgi:flavin reductase (DIM6/NTAB) family NADH-FMN oxidoreductase RutF
MKTYSGKDFIRLNPITLLSRDHMVLMAKKDGRITVMTVAWGEIGNLWEQPVFTVFVRPQRFSDAFFRDGTTVSLARLNESDHKYSAYFGTVSGRSEDKIAHSGLQVIDTDIAPYFAKSNLVLLGTKIYQSTLREEKFIDKTIVSKMYPTKDFHDVFVYRLEKVLVEEEPFNVRRPL